MRPRRQKLALRSWRDWLADLPRAGARAADGKRALPFNIQHQLQTNWCWSACACSTSVFYDATTTWGQCSLVNAELEQSSCCENGASGSCNVPWYLDRVLRRTGNFGSMSAS